jgi:hypothetical protein
MIAEKIKVKVSNFVSLILDNDAQIFGFVKKDETSNKNALLNKLIPNLLKLRKERRERIKEILQYDYQREDAEEIYECVNTVIDEVYFSDDELDTLEYNLWIRPNKESLAAFDEIEDCELEITALDMSSYIRGLLNEYSRFPQYKRQEIVFKEEIAIIDEACNESNILCFRYEGVSYKVFAYWHLYNYTDENDNYIVAYDIETQEISCFFIEKIETPYLLKKKFKPSEKLLAYIKEFVENEDYDLYSVLDLEGKLNDDEE